MGTVYDLQREPATEVRWDYDADGDHSYTEMIGVDVEDIVCLHAVALNDHAYVTDSLGCIDFSYDDSINVGIATVDNIFDGTWHPYQVEITCEMLGLDSHDTMVSTTNGGE